MHVWVNISRPSKVSVYLCNASLPRSGPLRSVCLSATHHCNRPRQCLDSGEKPPQIRLPQKETLEKDIIQEEVYNRNVQGGSGTWDRVGWGNQYRVHRRNCCGPLRQSPTEEPEMHMCVSQRTFWDLVTSSTMWVLGLISIPQAWHQASLLAEPSHQSRREALSLQCLCIPGWKLDQSALTH